MDSLQWIDSNATAIEKQLASVAKLAEIHRRWGGGGIRMPDPEAGLLYYVLIMDSFNTGTDQGSSWIQIPVNKNQNVFCKQLQNTVKRHFNCRYLIKCHFTIEAPCLTVGYTGIQFNFKTHFYQMSLGPAHVHFTVFIPDGTRSNTD